MHSLTQLCECTLLKWVGPGGAQCSSGQVRLMETGVQHTLSWPCEFMWDEGIEGDRFQVFLSDGRVS